MGNFVNISLWLCVAFLVADYPLQTNFVFAFRYKYKYGGIFHVSIHFVMGTVFLFPYLINWQIWVVLVVLNVLHYFIDTVAKKNIWMLFADQAAHLVLIVAGAFFAAGAIPMALPDTVARYYFSTSLPLYLIGYIVATFAGTIVIYFVKMTFRSDYTGRGIFGYEKFTGVLSRAATVTAILLGARYHPALFLAAPLGEGLRLAHIMSKTKDDRQYRDVYYLDVILSFVYAAAIGTALTFVR
ncbi:MAG: DUF3307 domain-containing protein [Candidatus Coatesbacteria bacterium]|nr:MAG: DUF3307 domain-containing protein [Candidatus Coatesbacteria bacterium]